MRVCPAKLALLACALAGACHKSSSSGAPVLASSRIGPEGGVLIVESGNQEGLIMTVEPGVLTEFVDFRIRDFVPEPLPPGMVIGQLPQAALPFRIEPEELVLDQSVRLRLPYQPTAISGTGPGNVEISQVSPYTERGYDPEVVDAIDGYVEIDIKTFGKFQVVIGDRLDPLAYVPPLGSVTQLSNGFAFEVRESTTAPFIGEEEWRITGPQFDEAIILTGYDVVGRVSESSNWLEVWREPFTPFPTVGNNWVISRNGVMDVESPIGTLPLGAAVQPFGLTTFEVPTEFHGMLLRDVLKLTFYVAYSRADLGSAERQMIYWFAPEVGLFKVSVDGIIYDRIP